MKNLRGHFYMLIMAVSLFTLQACSNNSAKADEYEVATMDSVSKDLEATNKELDEQAKKVEASLEKVDKEFKTAQ